MCKSAVNKNGKYGNFFTLFRRYTRGIIHKNKKHFFVSLQYVKNILELAVYTILLEVISDDKRFCRKKNHVGAFSRVHAAHSGTDKSCKTDKG